MFHISTCCATTCAFQDAHVTDLRHGAALALLLARNCRPASVARALVETGRTRRSVLGLKTVFACYRLLVSGQHTGCCTQLSATLLPGARRARPRWITCNGCVAGAWRHRGLVRTVSGIDAVLAELDWTSWQHGSENWGAVRSISRTVPSFAQSNRFRSRCQAICPSCVIWKMIRALAVKERQAAVNAVVYTDHAQRFNEMLKQANAEFWHQSDPL